MSQDLEDEVRKQRLNAVSSIANFNSFDSPCGIPPIPLHQFRSRFSQRVNIARYPELVCHIN